MKGIILLAGGKPKSGGSNPFEGSDEEEASESKSEAKAEGDDYGDDEKALAKKAGITDLEAFKKLLKVCSDSE